MVYTNDIDDIIDPATDIVVKLGRDYRAVNGIPIDFYERDDGTFIIGPSTAALVAASGKKSQTLFDVKPFNYINAKPIIDTSLYIGVGQKLSFNLYTGGGVLADRSSRGYTNTQLMLSSTHNDMQFGYALFNDNWLPADRYTDTGTDILGNKIPLRDALDRPIITNRLDIIESAYSATFGADSNINPNVDERFQATASPRFYGVDWYVRATPTTFNRLFTGIDQTTGVGTGATLNTSNVNNFEIGDDSYVEFYRSTLNIFTPINQTNTLTNYPSHFKIRSDKCILDTVTFNAEGSSATSLVLQKIPSRYINANGTERKAGQEFAFTSPTSSFVFVQSGANAFGQYGTTSTAGIQELGVTEDVKNITFDISWTTAIGFLSRNIDVILLDADDNQLAVKNIDTGSQGNSVTFNLPADLDTGVTSQAVRKLRVNVTTNNGMFSGTVGRALSITGTLAPVVIDINTFNIAQRFWTVPDYHKSDSIPHVSILGTVLPLVADADGKRTAKIKEIDARNFGLEGPIPAVSTTINPSTAAFIYTAFSGSDFGSYNDNVILEMDNILPATSVTFSASWTQAIASLTGRITTVELLDLNNIVVSTITLTSSSTSLGTAVFTGGNVSRATKMRIIGAGGSGPFSGTVGRTVTFTVVEEKAAITEGFGSDDYMQILDSQNNPVKATTKTDGNLVALRTVKSNFKASDTQLPVALNYKLTRTDTSKAADGADDVTGFNNSILNESLRQYTIPHGTLVSDNTATKATYTLAAGVYGYQIHSHSFTVDSTTGGLNGMDLGAEEIEYDFRVFDRNAGNLTNRISFDNSGSVPKFTRDRNQGAPTLEQFSDFVVSEELKLLGDTALTSRNNSFFTYNSSTRHFFFDNIDLDLGTFWPDLNPNITPPTEDSPLNHIVETTGEITSFDVGNLLFLTRDKNNTSFYLRAIPLATRVTYRYTDPVSGNPVQGGGVPIGNELVYGAWYRIPKDVDITFEFNFIGRENVLLNVSKEAIDLSTIVLTDLSDPEDIGDTNFAPFVDPAYTAKEIDFTNDVITVRGDMTRIEFIILMKKELQLTATPATKENNGLFILDGSRLQLLFNIVQHSSGGSVAGMTNVQLLNSTVTRQDITNARGIFGDAVVESADLNVVTITGFPTTGVSLLRIEGITTPVTVTDQISDYTIVIDKSETPLYYFKHELRQPVFGALPKSGSLALVLPERFVNIGTYTAGSNTIASVTINSKTAFTPDARVYSSTEVLQYLNDLQGNVAYASLQLDSLVVDLVSIDFVVQADESRLSFAPASNSDRVVFREYITPRGGDTELETLLPFRTGTNNGIRSFFPRNNVTTTSGGTFTANDRSIITGIKTQSDRLPTVTDGMGVVTGDVAKQSTQGSGGSGGFTDADRLNLGAVKTETDKIPTLITNVSTVDTVVDAVKIQTDKIPTVITDTTTLKTNLATVDTVVDAVKLETDKIPSILTDTTTLKTNLATVDTVVDAVKLETDKISTVVADTTTLKTNLETVDTVVDAVKVETDKIPSILTDTTTLKTNLATVDTVVDAVKVETDKIPSILTDTATLKTDITTVDTVVDAVKVQTDRLPTKTDGMGVVTGDVAMETTQVSDSFTSTDRLNLTAVKTQTDRLPTKTDGMGVVTGDVAMETSLTGVGFTAADRTSLGAINTRTNTTNNNVTSLFTDYLTTLLPAVSELGTETDTIRATTTQISGTVNDIETDTGSIRSSIQNTIDPLVQDISSLSGQIKNDTSAIRTDVARLPTVTDGMGVVTGDVAKESSLTGVGFTAADRTALGGINTTTTTTNTNVTTLLTDYVSNLTPTIATIAADTNSTRNTVESIETQTTDISSIKVQTDRLPTTTDGTGNIIGDVAQESTQAADSFSETDRMNLTAVKVQTDRLPTIQSGGATVGDVAKESTQAADSFSSADRLNLAAVKTQTDKLPTTIATIGDIEEVTGLTKVDTTFIRQQNTAINSDVDELQADVTAIQSDVSFNRAETTAIKVDTDKIDTVIIQTNKIPDTIDKIDDVKVQTDRLPTKTVMGIVSGDVAKESTGVNIPSTLTDNIVSIKTQTDKIPSVIVETDKITGIVTDTDRLPAIETLSTSTNSTVDDIKTETDKLPLKADNTSDIALESKQLTAAQLANIDNIPADLSTSINELRATTSDTNTSVDTVNSTVDLIKTDTTNIISDVATVDLTADNIKIDTANIILDTTILKAGQLDTDQKERIDAIPKSISADIQIIKDDLSGIEIETDKIDNVILLINALSTQLTNKETGLTPVDKADLIAEIIKTQQYDYQQTDSEFIITDSTNSNAVIARFTLIKDLDGNVIERDLQ